MKLRPLRDQVLVRRFESETTSAGGIVLPGKGEKTNRGEFVSVGPGLPTENGEIRSMSVRVGDKILFGGYHSDSNIVKIDDIEHVLMSENDILAVIDAE